MTVTVVLGAQWGDEGKGKIVDFLAQAADFVVRFQGGSNAGHTVVNEHGEFKLHLLPSGVFAPRCTSVLGTGTVIDPQGLLDEITQITSRGVRLPPVVVSDRAHVVLPYHRLFDQLEDIERGQFKVETTGRGIGPAYTDKYARVGIRMGDLLRPKVLQAKLQVVASKRNRLLRDIYRAQTFDEAALFAQCVEWGKHLAPYITDTFPLLRDAVRAGKNILLEGQLSGMKDIDWGSYPFVTSSSPTAGGASTGSGIPPRAIERVIGVAKAYSTQVGTGPMPTELEGAVADDLRQRGGEFGATTGRPRRVGWFDAVVTRYLAELNGFTDLVVTKLDLFDHLDEIPVCYAYEYQGQTLFDMPNEFIHGQCKPLYRLLPGWKTSTASVRKLSDLPVGARNFVEVIEELVGVPVFAAGVGPEREALALP